MMTFDFLKAFFRPPSLRKFPLKASPLMFSLDKISRGVDNIRYDVFLSPLFCEAAQKLVAHIVAVQTKSENIVNKEKEKEKEKFPLGTKEKDNVPPWVKEKDAFKKYCKEVMTDGINKAKLHRQIQIDYLGQAAIVKLLTQQIRSAYENLILDFKDVIRQYEGSRKKQEEVLGLKKELSEIVENRKTILRDSGREIFRYLTEIQTGELKEMREANFGAAPVLPEHFFSNPFIHAEDLSDDFFMIEEYDVLLGHRVEDPDKYDTLISFVKTLLIQIDSSDAEAKDPGRGQGAEEEALEPLGEDGEAESDPPEIEFWLREPENADILFNYFDTDQQRRILRKQKGDRTRLLYLKEYAREQKKILNFFYKKFRKKGLTDRIAAMYEMQPLYRDYCPPLVPQLVLQFLIAPKTRKGVKIRLKRLKNYYGKTFSLRPLRALIIKLEKIKPRIRKAYFIRFFKGVIRYHRDFQNFSLLKEAMDSISLVAEKKTVNLSRGNNALYEFLLPEEKESELKPVISHVIIKADIRGSTDVVHKMKEKGLNPATYFSLNFFDPITEILPEYGAVKVCIEGDAYILSIYERENTPEDWYSAARACGLAVRMLSIIRRCNAKNKKYELPELELGIGITYRNNAPTIFFDGDQQIMISSAINLADRLSGCSKSVRRKIEENKSSFPFNLYVFQTASDEQVAATADDLSARYNVNGIELDPAAFEKLSKEIDLKPVELTIRKKKQTFYTGKFPTVNGTYQRLIIRESLILRVDPDTLTATKRTDRNYYEIAANPKLYEIIK
jgi:hypothetical protein